MNDNKKFSDDYRSQFRLLHRRYDPLMAQCLIFASECVDIITDISADKNPGDEHLAEVIKFYYLYRPFRSFLEKEFNQNLKELFDHIEDVYQKYEKEKAN